MKDFTTYFSDRAIISHICKLRIKIAKNRNKKHLIHLLTDSEKFNYHVNENGSSQLFQNEFQLYQVEILKELDNILPPRKKWVKLGYSSRRNQDNTEFLSSNDKNYYSLLKTINLYKKNKDEPEWLKNLNKFVNNIQDSIICENYLLNVPIIYPKLKDKIKIDKVNNCRPISLFSLKDRIILSITNKFLTNLFDKHFQNSSYAFRSKKSKDDLAIITHHDCLKDVIELQKKRNFSTSYVVECDMEKFFDSVNHRIVKEFFNDLIIKVEEEYKTLDFKNPKHIFYQFLDCYSFNKNVPSPDNLEYWESYKIPNGKFEWIEESLINLGYYSNIENERIGIPQGGALSGLIANIVLNHTDIKMLETNVFYIRFCDDMLIIHDNFEECERAKEVYLSALKDLKLVHHFFNNQLTEKRKKISKFSELTLKPFWKCKSKGPYKWCSIEDGGFPWIGFVGYEIHHQGYIRVRKKSLEKELEKQDKIVKEIEKAIEKGMRKSANSIKESAINRLIGMSVGRVTLKNFEIVSNDMCWKNGFKELTSNKYCVQQMKHLDRNRNKLYYNFIKKIKEPEKEKSELLNSKLRQVTKYDKPFSYFYQIIERKK